jgi:DNA repair exonuclease SbcCD ATPase subunit
MANATTKLDTKALGFTWPKLERVQGDAKRLEEEQAATINRLNEIRQELQAAESADRDAYAAALLEGKDEPKTSKAEKLGAEQEALERRREALNSALQKLASRQTALMRENRTAWQGEVLDRMPDAQRRIEEAGRELLAAASEVNSLASLHDWIGQPERGYRRKTPAGKVTLNHQQFEALPIVQALMAQAARIGIRRPDEAA